MGIRPQLYYSKSRKAQIEHEQQQKRKSEDKVQESNHDMTVSEFLYEFIKKYGEKKWVDSTYKGNVGLLENYVHPYIGDKKLYYAVPLILQSAGSIFPKIHF